jgi:Mlc titration factor MtfA (ptsG expression regulator)
MILLPILILCGLIALYFLFINKKKSAGLPVELRDTYHLMLNEHISYYQSLNETEKIRFQGMVNDFLRDVRIEGVGTAVTELDKLFIASSAIIPVFGFGNWKYQNLTDVILYPDTFDKDYQFEGGDRNIMGMVGSGYMNGKMLLSRSALTKGFSNDAGNENAAIHEFVHLLDKADGATDGIPASFFTHEYAIPWLQLMHQEMLRIAAGDSDINPYALTNEAEFLAVAAEYFFEQPLAFKNKHPELYIQLSSIFKQNPGQA